MRFNNLKILNFLTTMLIFTSILQRIRIGPFLISQLITIVIISILVIFHKREIINTLVKNKYVYIFIFIYLVTNTVSSIYYSPLKFSSFKMIGWLFGSILCFLEIDVISNLNLKNNNDEKVIKYINIFVIIGIIEALYGMIGYILIVIGIDIGSTRIEPSFNMLAVKGTFTEHNIFGSYLLMPIGIILANYSTKDDKWCNIVLLLMMVSLTLSLSRSPWVAFFIQVFIIISLCKIFKIKKLYSSRNRMLARYIFMIFIFVFFTIVIIINFNEIKNLDIIQNIYLKFENLFNFNSGTGGFRDSINDKAMTQWQQSKLIGLGTNSYGQRNFMFVYGERIPEYLPNLWVGILYDSGIIGMVAYISFICIILISIIKSISKSKHKQLLIGGLGGIVAIMLAYITTNAMWFDTSWIYISLIYSVTKIRG